jgi:hypothetical protein
VEPNQPLKNVEPNQPLKNVEPNQPLKNVEPNQLLKNVEPNVFAQLFLKVVRVVFFVPNNLQMFYQPYHNHYVVCI